MSFWSWWPYNEAQIIRKSSFAYRWLLNLFCIINMFVFSPYNDHESLALQMSCHVMSLSPVSIEISQEGGGFKVTLPHLFVQVILGFRHWHKLLLLLFQDVQKTQGNPRLYLSSSRPFCLIGCLSSTSLGVFTSLPFFKYYPVASLFIAPSPTCFHSHPSEGASYIKQTLLTACKKKSWVTQGCYFKDLCQAVFFWKRLYQHFFRPRLLEGKVCWMSCGHFAPNCDWMMGNPRS